MTQMERIRVMMRMVREDREAETPEEQAVVRMAIERQVARGMDVDDRRIVQEETS